MAGMIHFGADARRRRGRIVLRGTAATIAARSRRPSRDLRNPVDAARRERA